MSFLNLFTFKSLRSTTILCLLFRFFINYMFVAPGVVLEDFAMDFFTLAIIMGTVHLLSSILGLLTYSLVPRRLFFMLVGAVSLLVSLVLLVAVPCVDQDQCSQAEITMQTVLVGVFRFLSCYAYNLMQIYITELFPSQIKPIASQIMSITSCLSFVIIPPIQGFFHSHHLSIFYSFALVSVAVGLIVFGLRETHNIPTPSMIEELAALTAEQKTEPDNKPEVETDSSPPSQEPNPENLSGTVDSIK